MRILSWRNCISTDKDDDGDREKYVDSDNDDSDDDDSDDDDRDGEDGWWHRGGLRVLPRIGRTQTIASLVIYPRIHQIYIYVPNNMM